jgi:hypothetical protein
LEVLLLRAYRFNAYIGEEDYNAANYEVIRAAFRNEAQRCLENKVEDLKRKRIEKVSFAIAEGSGADEIVALGRRSTDNLIACARTAGRALSAGC